MATDEFLIGKRERMVWIEETSYGTGGTIGNGEIVGANVRLEPNGWSQGWQEVLTAGADNRNVQDMVEGKKLYPYTMRFNPVNWRFLKYIMDVADAGSDPYTHTFTQANTINSWKLEWARRHTTPHVITLTGNFAKSVTLSWTKPSGEGSDGFIEVSMNCMARDSSEGSSVASVSNITKNPFQFRSVLLTIGGSEIVEVNNGDITIDNGINEQDSMYANATEDRLISDPIPKVFRIRGRFNVNLKDSTWYDYWDAATAIASTNSLKLERGTNDNIIFTLSNFRIKNPGGPTNLSGVTNADIVWTAEAFTSVVATDDVSTY